MNEDTENHPLIAFVGGGNMASSIISGLVSAGHSAARIRAADPVEELRTTLTEKYGIVCHQDNVECVSGADVVVLAVKPQLLRHVVEPLARLLKNSRPLVISIAAGISSDDIVAWSGERIPCVRAMPNTPALVNCGVSGLYANFECSAAQRLQAAELMAAVGKIVWVKDESLINTVTGVSGSGPAYFFKMMELMMEQAMANGLDAESAHTLVVETALGAAMLIRQSPLSPADLRKQVTSPRGTTDAAINAMENGGIDDAVRDGVQAAISRSAELSEQFGGA